MAPAGLADQIALVQQFEALGEGMGALDYTSDDYADALDALLQEQAALQEQIDDLDCWGVAGLSLDAAGAGAGGADGGADGDQGQIDIVGEVPHEAEIAMAALRVPTKGSPET